MQRWQAWTILALLLSLVLGMNTLYFQVHPFPQESQHNAFRLSNRLVHALRGQRSNLSQECYVVGQYAFVVADGPPMPWRHPQKLLQELAPRGRLNPLIGTCCTSYWTCMPHPATLIAYLANILPGRPILATLGISGYYLLLLLSVYGITTELGSRGAGLVAVALAAGYPGLFGFSRIIEGYLPATALATAMVFCLLRSKGLTRPHWAILFSLLAFSAIRSGEGLSEAIGVGLACAAPFALEVWQGFKPGQAWRARGLVLLSLGLVAGILYLSTDWTNILGGLGHILRGASDQGGGVNLAKSRGGPPWLLEHGTYLLLTWHEYLKPVASLLLLLALPLFLWKPHPRRLTMLLWLAIPFLATSAMTRKALWYALPCLPPMAVITALGLSGLERKSLRYAALALASLVVLQLPGFTLPAVNLAPPILARALATPWMPRPDVRSIHLTSPGRRTFARLATDTRDFLVWLEANVPRGGPLKRLAVVTDMGRHGYESLALSYYLELARPDFTVVVLPDLLTGESGPNPGLRPEHFAFYLRVSEDGFLGAYREGGELDISTPQNPMSATPELYALASAILERKVEVLPIRPPVIRLQPPEPFIWRR